MGGDSMGPNDWIFEMMDRAPSAGQKPHQHNASAQAASSAHSDTAATLQARAWPLAVLMPQPDLTDLSLPERDVSAYLPVYDTTEEAQAFLANQDAEALAAVLAAGDALNDYVSAAFDTTPSRRLSFGRSKPSSFAQHFSAYCAACAHLPEGALKNACDAFGTTMRTAHYLALACQAADACAAAGSTGNKADPHYSTMRDALRAACSTAQYPPQQLPALYLNVRSIPEPFKRAMQRHATDAWTGVTTGLRTHLNALRENRAATATPAVNADDAALSAVLNGTTFSSLPKNMQIGQLVQGEGIYIGVHTIKMGNLTRAFHTFAGDRDLDFTRSYQGAISEGAHGPYKNQAAFHQALQNGTYGGQWLLPPAHVLDTILKRSVRKHLSLGGAKPLFREHNSYSWRYWALAEGNKAWTKAGAGTLSLKENIHSKDESACRLVRFVPLDAQEATAHMKTQRTSKLRKAFGASILAASIFGGVQFGDSGIPAAASSEQTTQSHTVTELQAVARAARHTNCNF